jgi:hypothetical protein
MLLIGRHVSFSIDRIDRAFGYTHATVDALLWVYHQKISARPEARDRANSHATGVSTIHAVFRNNVGHKARSGALGPNARSGSAAGLRKLDDGTHSSVESVRS